MIKEYQSDTPFNSAVLTYTKRKEEVPAVQLDGLSRVRTLSFQLDEEVYEAEAKLFFKICFQGIMRQYHFALVLMDKKPQLASRSRSYKKLLYPHRQALGAECLLESEVMLPSSKASVLYSAVLLDADNFDYSCDNLLDSRFAFGLVFSKDADLSEAIRRVALDDLIEKHARPHKLLDLNPLLLIDQAVTPNSALLQRSSDGRDRVCLHFFYEDGPVAIGLGRLTRELSEIVKVR